MDANAEYSLLIFPPEVVEEQIRSWVTVTAGASLPSWGAHITLVNAFAPTGGIEAVQSAITQVCNRFQPFTLLMDNIVSRTHLARPRLRAVFLSTNPTENGHRELVRLQNELETALAPLKRDLTHKITFPDYNPHLSLTWGLPEVEAEHLVEAAQRAQLHADFQVDKVWMLAFSPSLSEPKVVERVMAFPLSANSAPATS